MADAAAVDASSLILFSKADLLPCLQLAAQSVIVPQAVVDEIDQTTSDLITPRVVRSTPWLMIVATPAIPDPIRRWNLGAGESAVLVWAWEHPGTEAVIDDRTARRCAVTFNIPVRGTLGLVLRAKQQGVIPLARPAVEQLRQVGLYLAQRVIDEALALVGE